MDYFSATSKEEFLAQVDKFVAPELKKSCVFEVFTRDEDENEALRLITSTGMAGDLRFFLKEQVERIVGPKGVDMVKKMLR